MINRDFAVQIPHGTLYVDRKDDGIVVHEFDGWAGKSGKWIVYHTFTKTDFQALKNQNLDLHSNAHIKCYVAGIEPNRTIAPEPLT